MQTPNLLNISVLVVKVMYIKVYHTHIKILLILPQYKKYECHLLGTGICMELVNDTIAMLLHIVILFNFSALYL